MPLAAGAVDVATWWAFSLDMSAGMRIEDVFLINFTSIFDYAFGATLTDLN